MPGRSPTHAPVTSATLPFSVLMGTCSSRSTAAGQERRRRVAPVVAPDVPTRVDRPLAGPAAGATRGCHCGAGAEFRSTDGAPATTGPQPGDGVRCAPPRPLRSPAAAGWAAATRTRPTAPRSKRCAVVLSTVAMDGIVVIGEGEKDNAPMLFNGEEIGDGSAPAMDIAVDPDRRHHAHVARAAGRDRGDRGQRTRHACSTPGRASTWRRSRRPARRRRDRPQRRR